MFNGKATITLTADDGIVSITLPPKGPDTENAITPVSETLVVTTAFARGTDYNFFGISADTNAIRNPLAVRPLAKAISKNHVTFDYYQPTDDNKKYLHTVTDIKKANLTDGGISTITIDITVTPQRPLATPAAILHKVYTLKENPTDATQILINGGPDHMLNGGSWHLYEPPTFTRFTTLAHGTYDVVYDVTLDTVGVGDFVSVDVTMSYHT